MKNVLKLIFYFVTLVTAGVVAALLVMKVINFDKSGVAPELEGMSITEASEMMMKRKLLLNVRGKEYNESIQEGHIISQDVRPGEKIKVGTEIGVIVSRGGALYSMPSFEGQRLEDVKLTLMNLSMKIRKITSVHSDTVEKGRIIAQRPLAGESRSNEINFLVSLGPYAVTYRCPSFVNMTADDARQLAAELGIVLLEKEKGSKVIFQKPEAGAAVARGDTVEITLGRGWGLWF